MKYESTILKRLIDTYGVVGNPRYISEIIKEFIVRGKECFPNLFTYQADWLAHIDEFGLNPTYTVTYTGQSIYAPNTLEKPVKSAILKGNTGYRDIDTGEILETFEEGRNLELVSVKMPVLTTYGVNVFFEDNTMEYGAWALNGAAVSTTSEIRCKNKHTPFPKGLKNGDKMYIVLSDTSINSDTNMHVYDENKTYISPDKRGCTVSNFINGVADVSINDIAKCSYFSFRVKSSNINCEFALMINDYAPYEPYKTNILSIPSDLELRGIGDVQDTLDLMTGELVQRTGKFMVDGIEDFGWYGDIGETLYGFNIYKSSIVGKLNNEVDANRPSLCSTLEYRGTTMYGKPGTGFAISGGSDSSFLQIVLQKEKLSDTTLDGIKQYLSENPLYFVVPLLDKSIKTVDLTILDQNGQNVKQLMSFNGGTHFNTKSSDGSPLPTVSVSVETDLEETLKVCSLDGNTL